MKRTHFRLMGASVGFAAFLLVSAPALLAAVAPSMGTASTFSVLAALSMSAAGAGTTVSGDLGLSPGVASSRTGPWTVGGNQYFGPLSLAATAQLDALTAFNNLAGQGSNGTWAVSPWSPVPGVWTAASDTSFTGTITLSGGFNDVWVFQVGRDMTFTGSVIMAGNAQACNVFWQIGRDATIAVGSHLVGTLIASRDVTLVSGATVDGRIISLNSSLTTDGNHVSGPTCAAAPPPPPPTATLQLRKIWAVNSIAGNTVTVTSSGFVNSATSGLSSTATSAGNAGNPTTGLAVPVSAGEMGTISEAFGVGAAANYTATLACTGNLNPLVDNSLTVNAADVAIVCTETNTLIPCPDITLTPATLPPITAGTAYSQTITVGGGGSRAYDFAVTAGALPAGLALTGATNTTVNITGMPTTAGPFSFRITATDKLNPLCFAEITYASAVGSLAVGGPTLDSLGLMILVLLLTAVGVLLVNRFTL